MNWPKPSFQLLQPKQGFNCKFTGGQNIICFFPSPAAGLLVNNSVWNGFPSESGLVSRFFFKRTPVYHQQHNGPSCQGETVHTRWSGQTAQNNTPHTRESKTEAI